VVLGTNLGPDGDRLIVHQVRRRSVRQDRYDGLGFVFDHVALRHAIA
jgi:hypothetical protein